MTTPFDAARPQEKLLILRRVPVFLSCSDEQLQFIADRTRLVEYKKGETVYQQGEQAEGFYIVSSGRLRVFSQVEGREEVVTILHNGDSFGEMSLLLGENHSATVQAINDTLVLSLAKHDFEDVINRIPSLVLYLSRLLSKRLRTRQRGDEFSESTIVALYSAATGVGRTSFAVALATQLVRETGHEVVMVDFSEAEAHPLLYGTGAIPTPARHTLKEAAAEGNFDEAVADHPLGFHVLLASALLADTSGEQVVAPLLSFLTKRFQYILIDLPVDLNAPIVKALTQSDLVYVITDSQPEHLIRTNALLHQMQASMGAAEQRIKIILNLREGLGAGVTLRDVTQQLRQPVAFTLPYVPSISGRLAVEEFRQLLDAQSPYMVTVRRTARELGGLLVGLALGSGAALGLAHIGVLKVIEQERIPIDLVAGSSIGGLVAGLWASGHSAADLERLAMEFKNPWDIRRLFILDFGIPVFSLFVGTAAGIGVGWFGGFWTGLLFGFMVAVTMGLILGPIAGGPIQGARLMEKLEHDFGGKTFEECWVPLKIVAANPMAREEVIFESGPLAPAVRASVSIPGIFKPIVLQGKVCLDGGVVNPIPVSVVKRFGANHVIAVNVFPTTPELIAHRQELVRRRAERDAILASRSLPFRLLFRIRQELMRSVSPIVFDVIMRSMQSMEHQIAEVACREADLTLRPTVPGSSWLEFFHPEKFIRRGEEVALQHLPELKRLTRGRHVDNV